MTDAPPHPITARFAQIMAALREAVAAACGRPALAGPVVLQARRPLAAKLAQRLHRRLGEMMQVFAALVAHLTAFGADAPPRTPRGKAAPRPDAAAAPVQDTPQDAPPDTHQDTPQNTAWPAAAARPESPPRAPRLPGHVGWLAGLSAETAAAASRLRHLLTDAEVLAMLRASPGLVQMLRPLCRMLGVALPADVLPPPSPDAAPKPPRRRRRRLWRPPSRRCDLMLLLRMGTPLIDT